MQNTMRTSDEGNRYQEQGYESRHEYLTSLADDHGVDPYVVFTLADALGPSEDFDGLVSELEDFAGACF